MATSLNKQMTAFFQDKIGSSQAYKQMFKKLAGIKGTMSNAEYQQRLQAINNIFRGKFVPSPGNSSQEPHLIEIDGYPCAYVYIMIKFGDLVHDIKKTRGTAKPYGVYGESIDSYKLTSLQVIRLKASGSSNPAKFANDQFNDVLETFDIFFNTIQWLHPATREKIIEHIRESPDIYNILRNVLKKNYKKEDVLASELLKVIKGADDVSNVFTRRPNNWFTTNELKGDVAIGGTLVDMISTAGAVAAAALMGLVPVASWDTIIDKGAGQGAATPAGIPKAILLNLVKIKNIDFLKDFKFDADMRSFRFCMKGNNNLIVEEFGLTKDSKNNLVQFIKFFNAQGSEIIDMSLGMSADQARLSDEVNLSQADHKTIGDAMIILRSIFRGYVHITGDRSASGICTFIAMCSTTPKIYSLYEDTNRIVQVSKDLLESFEPVTDIGSLKNQIYDVLDKKLDEATNLKLNRRNYIFREVSKTIESIYDTGELQVKLNEIQANRYTNLLNQNIFRLNASNLLKNSLKNFLAKRFIIQSPNFGNNITTGDIQELATELEDVNAALRNVSAAVLANRSVQRLIAKNYKTLKNTYKDLIRERAATLNATGIANEGNNGIEVQSQFRPANAVTNQTGGQQPATSVASTTTYRTLLETLPREKINAYTRTLNNLNRQYSRIGDDEYQRRLSNIVSSMQAEQPTSKMFYLSKNDGGLFGDELLNEFQRRFNELDQLAQTQVGYDYGAGLQPILNNLERARAIARNPPAGNSESSPNQITPKQSLFALVKDLQILDSSIINAAAGEINRLSRNSSLSETNYQQQYYQILQSLQTQVNAVKGQLAATAGPSFGQPGQPEPTGFNTGRGAAGQPAGSTPSRGKRQALTLSRDGGRRKILANDSDNSKPPPPSPNQPPAGSRPGRLSSARRTRPKRGTAPRGGA